MNSIIHQSAGLCIRSIRPSQHQLTRRTFSLASEVFESNTNVKNPAKADYKRLVKHAVDPLLFYFPFMTFVVGWPLLAEKVVTKWRAAA
ncbi:hypothetical protein BJ878DRAFT_544728 [Calycina marina]|uniref:Uncharacterized protein n=1 Tax=Calycina marina TaxID=1763456 RepID=A0A9P7YZD0_9HELO|nr:hypothetical protein BJ878DRAFT_544728 [Calycina marina]